MHYVYLIESHESAEHRYVGMTSDLKRRLQEHNSGQSPHTSKHMPWRLVTDCADCALDDQRRFEACRRRLQLLHRGCHAAFHAGEKVMRPMA
ncbi:MAG: GIY-YIG nuclease family protein [Hyphomicrobiales bacterium]|nr:GIY-YIG nuclease family protein [Hyphomicrobiales bacterium]